MAPGPGLWTTFFYYFSMMMLIGSFTASRALHGAWLDPDAVSVGVVLGIVAGIGGTYFNRSVTWELPIQGKKVFSNRLEQALRSLNYERVTDDPAADEQEQQGTEQQGTEQQGTDEQGTDEQGTDEQDGDVKGDPQRVYARSGAAAIFGGRLYVQVQPDKAQIVGRSSTIRRLKTEL